MLYMTAGQRVGLAASLSIEIGKVLERRQIRMDRKEWEAFIDEVVNGVVNRADMTLDRTGWEG